MKKRKPMAPLGKSKLPKGKFIYKDMEKSLSPYLTANLLNTNETLPTEMDFHVSVPEKIVWEVENIHSLQFGWMAIGGFRFNDHTFLRETPLDSILAMRWNIYRKICYGQVSNNPSERT